jgi:hypothetical protein
MNQFSFDVIGDKREDPNQVRKEDGFPVKNVELIIGAWTCIGPLSGRNLLKFLGETKFKDRPNKWSQDDYSIGQFQVYRTQFYLELEDIQDIICFLEDQEQSIVRVNKEGVEYALVSNSEEQYYEASTPAMIPIFESAINWLQTSADPWRSVRLRTKYFG